MLIAWYDHKAYDRPSRASWNWQPWSAAIPKPYGIALLLRMSNLLCSRIGILDPLTIPPGAESESCPSVSLLPFYNGRGCSGAGSTLLSLLCSREWPRDWGMANGMWAERGKASVVASHSDFGKETTCRRWWRSKWGAQVPASFRGIEPLLPHKLLLYFSLFYC